MASTQGLPRATFAKLSPHTYLLANLDPSDDSTAPRRSNGRSPRDARQPFVNTSSLSNPHGSSLVRIGDTTAICGVRGETILTADIPNYRPSLNGPRELSDYDLLVPNIELATGCAPQFLPGLPPTTLAQTLSTRLYSLLHSSGLVNPDDLRIWHSRPSEDAGTQGVSDTPMGDAGEDEEAGEEESVVVAYWVLYIDIFFISFDGNPFDAAWAAVLAALRDTKLPQASWDTDRELILCQRENPKPLGLSGFPIACTSAIFNSRDSDQSTSNRFWLLLDPDTLEENLCDETITAVVDRSAGETRILSISKHGGTIASPELLKGYITVAERRWDEFHRVITQSS